MSRLELKIIPDVVALIVAGMMWLVTALTPSFAIPRLPRLIGVGMLLAGGLVLVIAARISFSRAGTTFNPTTPQRSSDLVTGGVYRATRNPMYLGTLLVLLACGVWLSNPHALLVSGVFVAYIKRFQIEPEERALRARFGTIYDAYAAGVRRWI